jgi:hypothetical protein
MTRHTTYPKISYRGFIDFEILQIQVFHICIFMQKLSGISSGQNNKSCRIIHCEPKKIGFEFF